MATHKLVSTRRHRRPGVTPGGDQLIHLSESLIPLTRCSRSAAQQFIWYADPKVKRMAAPWHHPVSQTYIPRHRGVRFVLSYPLAGRFAFPLRDYREAVRNYYTVGDICWQIAHAYVKIYEQPDRYGVWGHAINDLVIEDISYHAKTRTIQVGMGS